MTQREFSDISTWYELLDFCNEEDLDSCGEVYLIDEYDGEVCEDIRNFIDSERFFDLVTKLSDLPDSGYDAYIKHEEFDWQGSYDGDSLFEEYKEDVEAEALRHNVFEHEEDYEEPEEIFDDPEDDEPLPEEEFDVFKLTTDTAKLFQQLKEKETEEEKEASAKFASLLGF